MRHKDVWDCKTPLELAELVNSWDDNRATMNLTYMHKLSNEVTRQDKEIARLKAENERLQEDVEYLVKRQNRAGAMSFAAERDHGISSNAIVRFAYGGKEPSENEMPWDRSDLAACELAVKRLPEHRKSSPVMIALANARKAVRR